MSSTVNKIIPLSELPLSNDFMFGAVMSRKHIAKLFLESLLDKEIARIEYAKTQETVEEEYYAHGVRLDVYLKDKRETVYNIEMQARNENDLERRIRYIQGKMDRETLSKGKHYIELPDSYVIFVCAFDYFHQGLAVYERESTVKGCNGLIYNDGSYSFILNSRFKKGNAATPILEFLDFVRRNDSNASYTSELANSVAKAVDDVRHDRGKEKAYMTFAEKLQDERYFAFRDGKAEGIAEGKAEGIAEGIAKGKAEGIAEGIAKGKVEGKVEGKAEGKANLLAGLSSLINFLKPLGRENEINEAIKNPEKLAELQEEFDVKTDD